MESSEVDPREEQRKKWRASSLAYRKRNPERAKSIYTRFRKRHSERLKVRNKELYYLHHQRRLEIVRKSNQKHRHKRREYQRKYSIKHKAELALKKKQWKEKNRHKFPAFWARYKHSRRAKLKGCKTDIYVRSVVERIKSIPIMFCYYCRKNISKTERSVEHIIPLVRGGSHSSDNICACCLDCNSSKRHRTLSEWCPGNQLLIPM